MDPFFGYLNFLMADRRLQRIKLPVDICDRYCLMIHKCKTANPASCQCFHCIGACTSQTENSNLSCTQTVNSLLT